MYYVITFVLFAGHMLADQKEPTPFTIEWIPDILPSCHIGELRIKFQYGHQKNGLVERRVDQEPADGVPQSQQLQETTVHVQEVNLTNTDQEVGDLVELHDIELQNLASGDL